MCSSIISNDALNGECTFVNIRTNKCQTNDNNNSNRIRLLLFRRLLVWIRDECQRRRNQSRSLRLPMFAVQLFSPWQWPLERNNNNNESCNEVIHSPIHHSLRCDTFCVCMQSINYCIDQNLRRRQRKLNFLPQVQGVITRRRGFLLPAMSAWTGGWVLPRAVISHSGVTCVCDTVG